MGYYVEIYHIETRNVEKSMGPMGERKAERVQLGALMNMGSKYSARIVKKPTNTAERE